MLVKIVITLVGAGLGVLCGMYAVLLGGAGHGWTSAWPYGGMSLILFPLAFYNLSNYRKSPPAFSVAMLVVAIVLDLFLYSSTVSQGVLHFERTGSAAWAWIALWSVWQVAFAAALFLAPTRVAEPASRTPRS
ncbi:hypothetical protein ACSFA2_05340 [Variovorax sp. LT2P21]|uniref:hypothetical protein n=1 Tax=Variovorax sp. LT2P21 TaxID=3443731 RepID=UPI003F45E740